MKTKLIFCVFILVALFFASCSKDEPDAPFGAGSTESQEGRVTFTFPNVNGVTTYATIANQNESRLNMENMYIYVVGGEAGKEMIEKVFTGKDIKSIVSGASVTATVSVPERLMKEEKTFYFMADMGKTASRAASTLVDGTPLDTLSKATTNELDDKTLLSSADGLLLTGKIKANLKTDRTAKIVTLKRRVARFDVSNNSDSSKVTIKSIYLGNVNYSGYVFAENPVDHQENAKKGKQPVIPFAGVENANVGHASSVFYLYPTPGSPATIRLLATVNGIDHLFNVPLPEEGIEANKRYTITAKVVDVEQLFEVTSADWIPVDDVLPAEAGRVILAKIEASEAGWNAETNTFNPDKGGELRVTMHSQHEKGVKIEIDPILDANGYASTIKHDPLSVPQLTYSVSYTQTVKLIIPKYTRRDSIHIQIRFRDNVTLSPSETVITVQSGGTENIWAGSNIYWDGSRLMFDDVGVTANENYQGVFFKWGSLWGISPAGVNWSDKVVVYKSDSKGGHQKVTGVSWKDIPYMTTGTGTDRDSNWASRTENQTADLGDICKYLSPLHGRTWRMPTSREFGKEGRLTFPNTQPYEQGGVFQIGNNAEANAAGSNHPDGSKYADKDAPGYFLTSGNSKVFFPAAGIRDNTDGTLFYVGYNGLYWSSSPNGTNGYRLGLSDIAVNPANINDRAGGLSVRCVVDVGQLQ